MRLSHSQKEMYQLCPRKWELHYKERLRSTKEGSALLFGNAMDEALNRLLLEKKKDLTEEETESMEVTPEQVFKDNMEYRTILDESVYLPTSLQATYFKSDCDPDLLEPQDVKAVLEVAQGVEINLNTSADIYTFLEEVLPQVKIGLDNDTQLVYNNICWHSLYRKGLMLLDVYRKEIMPQIEEVFAVQKEFTIEDGDDSLRGVIDVICSFHDEPGVAYVGDNKTSSKPYKADSVSVSTQLATYSEYEKNPKCAYLVLEKKLRKREPRTRHDVIKDDMPTETIDNTFSQYEEVLQNIGDEKFDKNLDSCFTYGQKCPYYDYCRTGELKNLKYVEKKDANK